MSKIKFEDLFNIDDIQRLQEEFTEATGVASIITHTDGIPITSPSNFCRLCSNIIRKSPKGLENCFKSDAVVGSFNPDGPIVQTCLSGGLWDAGAGISVGGQHIANWLIGQVRDETQTEESMIKYAQDIGVDEQTFIKAFREVPSMSHEQFCKIAKMLFTLANQLSNIAYKNLQQAKLISDRKKVEEARIASMWLSQIMENSSQSQIIAAGLEEGVKLTDSLIGFFHFVNSDQNTLKLQSWSRDTLKVCSVEKVDKHYPIERAGVWVDCIHERRPVIHNDYQSLPNKKGLPDGHVPIVREMAVPIIEEDKIVAVIGVGNKPENYNQYDIDMLSILTGSLWSIVRKKRFDDELLRLNKELEQRVELRTKELEQVNKDLEGFSYSVSHDLRAPLRHISGYINLLGRQPVLKSEGKHRHYMDMILDSSQKMGQLIDDLLVFSRMGRAELKKEHVNFNEIIDDIVRSRKLEIEGRTINWRVAQLPTVDGDRNMLRVVMDNLISNAIKYTRNEAAAEIEIGFYQGEGNRNVIFIRDNGVGFNMDYAHKLYGVFQRLHSDEEFEGTGIGLATVERILHRHHGTIRAESREGQGAVFYLTI